MANHHGSSYLTFSIPQRNTIAMSYDPSTLSSAIIKVLLTLTISWREKKKSQRQIGWWIPLRIHEISHWISNVIRGINFLVTHEDTKLLQLNLVYFYYRWTINELGMMAMLLYHRSGASINPMIHDWRTCHVWGQIDLFLVLHSFWIFILFDLFAGSDAGCRPKSSPIPK